LNYDYLSQYVGWILTTSI